MIHTQDVLERQEQGEISLLGRASSRATHHILAVAQVENTHSGLRPLQKYLTHSL